MLDEEVYASEMEGVGKRRLANVISVLLPAREYRLECSWTTERPLPAIEEFACRLILMMESASPGELQAYFGLSKLETDGLVGSLARNRLVDVADDGVLLPSAILRAKQIAIGEVPTFTTFETREEDAVFDLLALQLVPRRSYSNSRFGLPEVPMPELAKSVAPDRIAEAFSEQSRAFLEFSRGRTKENFKTHLYKVARCRPMRTLQVPVDMEISLDVGATGDLNVHRDAVERLGENRKRPLSIELESKVADYLASESLPKATTSFSDFCALVEDEVLARYVREDEFDLSKWLRDRDANKTGYGSQLTRGLLGPIYLVGNRTTLINMLRSEEHEEEHEEERSSIAHWLPADVPFWAANNTELVEFVAKFQKALDRRDGGRLVTCFKGEGTSEERWLKKKFHSRLPHAVMFTGGIQLDRFELLVVPERFAVAQYHVQPSKMSAVTLPIGYATTDPDRVDRITRLLSQRLASTVSPSISWSTDSQHVQSLIDFKLLGIAEVARPKPSDTARESGATHIALTEKSRPKIYIKRSKFYS